MSAFKNTVWVLAGESEIISVYKTDRNSGTLHLRPGYPVYFLSNPGEAELWFFMQ